MTIIYTYEEGHLIQQAKMALADCAFGNRSLNKVIKDLIHDAREFERVESTQTRIVRRRDARPEEYELAYPDDMPIGKFTARISPRAGNCLRAEGFETVGDIREYTDVELTKIPNFGKVSLLELKDMLRTRTKRRTDIPI